MDILTTQPVKVRFDMKLEKIEQRDGESVVVETIERSVEKTLFEKDDENANN